VVIGILTPTVQGFSREATREVLEKTVKAFPALDAWIAKKLSGTLGTASADV
jgi:hypothetical protein